MKFADLDLNKAYTYADYFKWQFEERVELLKGKIFAMSPAPRRHHQKLVLKIGSLLDTFLNGATCEVYVAPFDVRLPGKTNEDKDIVTVVQPDVCVVCDPSKLDDRGCIGAPDIVVEILSPSNNKKELKFKYEIYEEAGVKEYWIVFPPEKSMLIYTLTNGKYIASPFLYAGDNAASAVLSGFSLNLKLLFASLPDKE